MEFLKSINEHIKVKNYYSQEIFNGRSYIGNMVDKILFRIISFIVMCVYVYIKTGSIFMSINIALNIIIIYSLIMYKLNNKKLDKTINTINQNLVKDSMYKLLIDQDKDEYINFFKELLEETNKAKIEILKEKEIDMIEEKANGKIAIKCFQYTEDHKVDNDFGAFLMEIRRMKINKAMLVTTSSFSENVKKITKNFNDDIDVSLIDMNEIVNILSKSNKYPSKDKIKNMIIQKLDDKKLELRKESIKGISNASVKKCIVSGITLLIFGQFTKYIIYYNVVSYILISIGIILFVKEKIDLLKSKIGT